MVGLPGESPETLQDTARLAQELGIYYGYHMLAPFPGTTVREEIEKYDLEILTDDWSLYDANHPVVRTSRVSPEDMEAFVRACEDFLDHQWQEVLKRYESRQCTPHEELLVVGKKRMHLIFKLLSEDIIEQLAAPAAPGTDPAALFTPAVLQKVGGDGSFVSWTLKTLIDAGYIKYESANGNSRLYWTHNLEVDRLPVA